jgi:hypothetical protein
MLQIDDYLVWDCKFNRESMIIMLKLKDNTTRGIYESDTRCIMWTSQKLKID